MSKIRVLLVEDSITVRKRLVEALERDPSFEVIGEAGTGERGIELCEQLRPDVITMDLMLPGTNGLIATGHIMAHCPTPILIVSASSNRGEVFKTYDALAAGAVEVIEKPSGLEDPAAWEREFLSTLRVVSRVRVITHPRARRVDVTRPTHDGSATTPGQQNDLQLAVLGASMGGPSALVEFFHALPEEFALPILLVIHIGNPFAPSFADWLRSQIGREAKYAADGESLRELGGCVRLAPPDQHLAIRSGRLQLTRDPPRHFCRPSVDVLFESAATECGQNTAACLMTGMGRDGAAGLLSLRRAGALTMAQDEASCVVFGMPREAVLLGAAERVLRPSSMARALARHVAAGGRAGGSG